jgi:hypothetical protein
LHLKHFTEILGFVIAYYLRDKNIDEVNAFFNLKSDFKEEEVDDSFWVWRPHHRDAPHAN